MIFPQNITDWTSRNDGSEHIELVYLPSFESKVYFEALDLDQRMDWSVISTDPNEILIRLNFTKPFAVSSSLYDLDSF